MGQRLRETEEETRVEFGDDNTMLEQNQQKGQSQKMAFLLYLFNASKNLTVSILVTLCFLRLLNLQTSFMPTFTITAYGISGLTIFVPLNIIFCFFSDYETISLN